MGTASPFLRLEFGVRGEEGQETGLRTRQALDMRLAWLRSFVLMTMTKHADRFKQQSDVV